MSQWQRVPVTATKVAATRQPLWSPISIPTKLVVPWSRRFDLDFDSEEGDSSTSHTSVSSTCSVDSDSSASSHSSDTTSYPASSSSSSEDGATTTDDDEASTDASHSTADNSDVISTAEAELSDEDYGPPPPPAGTEQPSVTFSGLADADFRRLVIERILPLNFQAACSLAEYALRIGVSAKRYEQCVLDLFQETVHKKVHDPVFLGADGAWSVRPITYYLRYPAVALNRWLEVLSSRNRLAKLAEDAVHVDAIFYWDAGARTICGYRTTVLCISFPSLHVSPGALDAVFPLLFHAGPSPCFRKAQPKLRRHAVPPVRETLYAIIANLLRSIQTDGVRVPSSSHSEMLKRVVAAFPDASALHVDMINISDMKAVGETTTAIVQAHVPQFPYSSTQPNKSFQNRFHYETSPSCHCTIAQQMSRGATCADEVRRSIPFFPSPAVPPLQCCHMYGRHSLLHGLPCLGADLAQILYKSGLEQHALLMCAMFPAPGFDPLRHLLNSAGPPVRRKALNPTGPAPGGLGGNSRRPPHDVRLNDVKVFIRNCQRERPDPLAEFVQSRGRFHPSPADIACVLRMAGLDFVHETTGLTVTLATLWISAVAYSRFILDPELLPGDGEDVRRDVRELGRQIFTTYKSALAKFFPWAPPVASAWFEKLPQNQQIQLSKITFAVNQTAIAQSCREFFVWGSALISRFGRAASYFHEEAFEHLFIYFWLICFCMGKLIAEKESRLDYSAMLLWAAAWGGFPPVTVKHVRKRETCSRVYVDTRS